MYSNIDTWYCIYLYNNIYKYFFLYKHDESRSGQVVIEDHIYNHNHTSPVKLATDGQSDWQEGHCYWTFVFVFFFSFCFNSLTTLTE